jgi:hypothetical protein
MSFVEINRFIKSLRAYTDRLSRQQIKTLRGQALVGDITGAKKGLERICRKEGTSWKYER